MVCFVALLAIPVSAEIMYMNETHGATWIQYRYGVNASDVGTPLGLKLTVDGTVVNTIYLNSTTDSEFTYLLSDVNANEKHIAVVEEYVTSTPPVLVSKKQSSVMSSQSNDYFYLVFVISIFFILAGLFLKSGLRSVIMFLASVLLNLYLTLSVYVMNVAFSTITTIVAIIAGFLLAYTLYEYAKSLLRWESD